MTDTSYDDPLRPHVFDDDIQEYDNRLPNWWLWSWYIFIILFHFRKLSQPIAGFLEFVRHLFRGRPAPIRIRFPLAPAGLRGGG